MAEMADSREELRAQLVEQLQADRQAALAAGNTAAAVSASKAIADLLSIRMRPDEEPDDEREPEIDPRQCARAVLSLLSEASAQSGVSIHFAQPGEKMIRVSNTDADLIDRLFPETPPEEASP